MGLLSATSSKPNLHRKITRGVGKSLLSAVAHAGLNSALLAATGLFALSWSPAQALEPGFAQSLSEGVLIGASAGVPPPGIYMINQIGFQQTNLVGPGTKVIGSDTGAHVNAAAVAFLFVPGWTIFGATYDAVAIPAIFEDASIGNPVNIQESGRHNSYFVPAELSWKLGNSGFQFKTGLGISTPDGTVTGRTGTGNVGSPYWTFVPEGIISYLADGWNLSAAMYAEFNTKSTVSGYQGGNVLHTDLTATKTIGKWTLGPVAYYEAQVSNDSCSSIKCQGLYGVTPATVAALTDKRFQTLAVGGLVGYNFGPAALSVWVTQEVFTKASNAAAAAVGADVSVFHRGLTVFTTLSFRIWAPEEAQPVKTSMHLK